MNSFGDEIKRIRKEKGLSIRELAKKSGISHPYISQIENGKRKVPNREIVKKIAEGLNEDADFLLYKAGYWDIEIENEKNLTTEEKDQKVKEFLQSLNDFFDYHDVNTKIQIPVTVPKKVQVLENGHLKFKTISNEKDVFDLLNLLQMYDVDLYFSNKLLTRNDRISLLDVLEKRV